jgi:hypothetical protein
LGGVSLDRFDIISFNSGKYLVRAVVFDKKINRTWVLVIVYGAAQEGDKEEFLVEIAQVCSNQTFPLWLVGISIF